MKETAKEFEWLTSREVAELKKCSTRTVLNACLSDELACVFIQDRNGIGRGRGLYLIHKEDAAKWQGPKYKKRRRLKVSIYAGTAWDMK